MSNWQVLQTGGGQGQVMLKPEQEIKRVDLPPSKFTQLDFTNMTFTVELKGTNLTVYMTSETRFFKDGRYAISKDLKEGGLVRGKLKKAADDHDRPEAVRIFWGKPSPRER